MQIIPAIDILDGRVTRLTQGNPESKERYDTPDPLLQAKHWVSQGAPRLHIIDLDAALGKQSNLELIETIAESITVPVQVGGGIRSKALVDQLLQSVDRVILGSMLFQQQKESLDLLDRYGSKRLVTALDHKNGKVMSIGWQKSTNSSLYECFNRFKDAGFTRFLITNVENDGTLKGPDIETYRQYAGQGKVIASGGVSSLSDILSLKATGVDSVVIGKALYLKRFTLQEAMEAAVC